MKGVYTVFTKRPETLTATAFAKIVKLFKDRGRERGREGRKEGGREGGRQLPKILTEPKCEVYSKVNI